MAKTAPLSVVLPTTLVKVAKSRSNPTQSADKGQVLRNEAVYSLLNEAARAYKSETNMTRLLRQFARSEGPLSTAVMTFVQMANCRYTLTVYDAKSNQFSKEGTTLAVSILSSMDTLYDFTEGFSTKKSIKTLLSHMLREIVLTGASSCELVLNKARLPSHLQVVPFETLEMVSDGKGSYTPQQRITGVNDPVSLDLATFFVSYLQHDASSAYSFSMMDSAIKLIVYFEEFMDDIRRSVRQNGHTRTKVSLDTQKISEAMPPSIRNDPKKNRAWMEAIRDQVQAQLENLSPEDAMVFFNTVEVDNLQSGLGSRMDYTPLLSTISGMYATSMKTPPSAIGLRLEGGSQALGNIESLIFIKTAAALQGPVVEILSRGLSLGCRLYGMDVYAKFEFKPINLRPEEELAAFRSMEQTRILELLSLGFYDDDYAAHILETGPRPASSPPLSGTMFHAGGLQEDPTTPGDTPMGRTLQPDKKVPRKAGGKSQ